MSLIFVAVAVDVVAAVAVVLQSLQVSEWLNERVENCLQLQLH